VLYVVTGTPDGEVRYVHGIVDGRVADAALGDDPAAEITLTQSYADAREVAEGRIDAVTAFMQGRAKVVGDMGKVLALMPFMASDEHRAAVAQVTSQTAF
jgi:putative sterol carrier protein